MPAERVKPLSWGLSLGTSARAEGTVQGLRCRWSGHKGEQTGEGCKLGDRARDRHAKWSATDEICVHMDTCRFPIEERVRLSCVVSLSSNRLRPLPPKLPLPFLPLSYSLLNSADMSCVRLTSRL